MNKPIDIAAFGELIDDYQCAQKDGTLDERANARHALMNAYRAALASSDAQADGGKGEAVARGFDVALGALADYQNNWDTGLVQPYAESERVAMECAVEAVRDALNEAKAAAQLDECAPREALPILRRIAHELRTYNPAADEHKGEHIHKVWAREIYAAIEQTAKENQS